MQDNAGNVTGKSVSLIRTALLLSIISCLTTPFAIGADAVDYYNSGQAKYAKGDLSGALDDFNKVVELLPDVDKVYINRGNVKKDKGDGVGALADYNKAIDLNPRGATAYYNRGILKGTTGDSNGALADFSKAI